MEHITVKLALPDGTRQRLTALARIKRWSVTSLVSYTMEQLAWPEGVSEQQPPITQVTDITQLTNARARLAIELDREDREILALQQAIPTQPGELDI